MSGVPVLEAAVEAKNGRVYVLDGVLMPPSILPLLPHRCDITESKVLQVRFLLFLASCCVLRVRFSNGWSDGVGLPSGVTCCQVVTIALVCRRVSVAAAPRCQSAPMDARR